MTLMKRSVLLAALLLTACENRDRLSDEEASQAPMSAANETIVPDSGGDAPSPSELPADPGEELYKALGTEPGWALTIRRAAMLYQGNYGTVRIVEATPPTFRPSGQTRSGRLTISIKPGPCSDGMSDHVWRDKVTVSVAGGATSSGCGGGLMPVNKVEDAEYSVTAINGRPTGGGVRFRIRFSGDEITGAFGCNSFSGRFKRNGDHLAIPQIVATQMGCGGALGQFEREGFAILESNLRIEQESGRTRLVSEAGSIDLQSIQQETPDA